MYAFVSHTSACDALRTIGGTSGSVPRWPAVARELPRHRNTVTNQGMLKQLSDTVDLRSYGLMRTPIDLLVPRASERSRGKVARFHAWRGDVPASSMLRLSEELFVSTPEFVLVQMAGWHTRITPVVDEFSKELHEAREARARVGADGEPTYDNPFIWDNTSRLLKLVLVAMEFMGTYRLGTPGQGTSYGRMPLTTANDIERFVTTMPRVYGKNRIKEALSLAVPHAASPMETALTLMLSLPTAYGGFGLPRPKLNRTLVVNNHEMLWSGGPAITPDVLWEDAKLVIEYDSDEWHGGAGMRKLARDASRSNVLIAMGYHVLRVTTLNIQQLAEVERLARQVAAHMGIALAEPDEVLRVRRVKLHGLLMAQ